MIKRGTRVAVVVCLVFASCSYLPKPSKPPYLHTQEDVGMVQVGIQSVAPFEDYISSLEPQFELKPQDALASAIAQTEVEDSALVNQFLATLQIALPQITRAKTPLLDENKQPTGSEIETHTTTPPAPVTATAPSTLTPSVTVTVPSTASVNFDSALLYRAATALAQEVSLLNHYVRDAAVRTGTKPYIVRLLVTVMPGARNEPYDAYTTVSFFTSKKQDPPIHSALYDAIQEKAPDVIANDLLTRQRACEANGYCKPEPVNVIPLLVTDDLEANLHTNALERIRDISLALQGTLSNIGLGVGTRSHTEELDKTLSKNLNSIYALGQPAPNAVVARLGAAYANGDYVTVPRSYSVSLLVLAKTLAGEPAGDEAILNPSITFTATSQFHDAHSRGFKQSRSFEASTTELRSLLESRGIHATESDAQTLLNAAQTGDFSEATGVKDASAAWSDAVWVSQRSGRSAGNFVVTLPRVSLPSNRDHFSLIDDGTSMTLAINHAANLLPDRLHANVAALFGENDWVFLSNADVKVGSYGRSATFTFPSLNKIVEMRAANAAAEAKAADDAKKAAAATPSSAKKASTKSAGKIDVYGAHGRKAKERHPRRTPSRTATATKDPNSATSTLKVAAKPVHVFAEVVYGRSLTAWSAGTLSAQPELQWYPMLNAPSTEPLIEAAVAANILHKFEGPIPYVLTKKPEEKAADPGFSSSVPAAVISDLDGAGKMLVELRDTGKDAQHDLHLQIMSGAFIDKDSEPGLKGADHVASDAGAYLLSLHGLRPGTPLVLHAFRMQDKTPVAVGDTTVQVIAATPKPEPKKEKEK